MGKKRQRATSEGGYADAKGRWRDAHHTTSTVEIPGPLADAIDNLTNILDIYMRGKYCYSIMKLTDTYTGDIVAAVNTHIGSVSPNRGE